MSNPAKWPAGLLAAVIVLVLVALLGLALPAQLRAGLFGQIATSAAGLAQ